MSDLEPIIRLTKDLANSARSLGRAEARFLVDNYYQMQRNRIRAGNQVRALTASSEPHEVLLWLSAQSDSLEGQIKRALAKYAEADPVGRWSMSIYGVGPVIAAGLLAHIDIEKAPTVGHIWRFAGLDPTNKWEKGAKRPWNASLKTLCWKIGESFCKFKANDECFYGKLYEQRKAYEIARNDAGELADQAAATLAVVPNHKQKDIYKTGRLPDGRLDMRAKRYATKIFLAHWHEVAYEERYGKPPPLPYSISHLGHAHVILRP